MKTNPVTILLPDMRGVGFGRYGIGNFKLGFGVYTYSRLAGAQATCPGATPECEEICYAKRIEGPVQDVYAQNSWDDGVPPIPAECKLLRIHVSGDFTTVGYVKNWMKRLGERPDVLAWAYTRSWRVPRLVPILEELRAMPNIELFASMDPSKPDDAPPAGWRRAWIYRDTPHHGWPKESRLHFVRNRIMDPGPRLPTDRNMIADDGVATAPAYVCPEETGHKQNCIECGYCFEGRRHDVVFLEH